LNAVVGGSLKEFGGTNLLKDHVSDADIKLAEQHCIFYFSSKNNHLVVKKQPWETFKKRFSL
jgi:hypothetical protein